jgi:dolichyl-phosphate-mannose--protein O-mannosyl transferase
MTICSFWQVSSNIGCCLNVSFYTLQAKINSEWLLCFGRLEIEGAGSVWLRDQKIRLRHVDTNGYLHSHDKKYSRIVTGQQEVCGFAKKTSDNIWSAAEGVYFPARSTA